ncbi:hypothetical protein AArcSl_1243 [Halalkaliarchaeum desulfuricum]|uniref:Uncharacterized protein n=1 Tax=Halalkaliarchaeum desulfuricum TaxID=2055893 RepID=A0A343TIF3_9EURY|nr:hypothetical protein [Halalkaliarchaeum desulfuricum]AUX08875.1 hypothetical protein AArcSl_1243 [Halalkaliarchaeum desulfuricum]
MSDPELNAVGTDDSSTDDETGDVEDEELLPSGSVSTAMRFGLFDMIGLATTLVFAIPLANVGVLRILGGETLFGAGLVAVAVAMVVLPQFFFNPGRIVKALVSGLVPRRLRSVGDGSATADGDGISGHDDGIAVEDGSVTVEDGSVTDGGDEKTEPQG